MADPSARTPGDEDLEEGELPQEQQGEGQAPPPPPPPPAFQFGATTAAPARAPFFASEPRAVRRAAKKAKKKAAKAGGAASGFYDVYGPQALPSVEVKPEEGPIRLADVQNLLLWVLAEGTNPRWCFVKNKPLVKRVFMLALHGLDSSLYEQSKHLLPNFGRLLGEPVELQARNPTLVPGQSVHGLFTVPQTKKRRREDAQQPAEGQPGAEAAAEAEGEPEPEEQQHQPNGNAGVALATSRGDEEAAGAENGSAGAPPAKLQRLKPGGDVSTSGMVAAEAAGEAAAAAAEAVRPPAQAPKFVSIGTANGSSAGRPFPPSHYVMTLAEMQQHNYPLPEVGEGGEMVCPEGFVATEPCGGAPQNKLVALDCEMCITDEGFELTRATLIDEKGQVLLDELVVPVNPITDYNTRYSGITAEMLAGVTTRLPDVQRLLKQHIAAETLVVMHSGENDLKALKLIHANVLDTSVMFPHPRGPPYKSALRVLASRHLLRTIQRDSHDPVEDARAALDLALLKIEKGPSYGMASSESGERLADVLTAAGRRCTLVGSQASLNRLVSGNCSAVVAESDAEALAALGKEAGKEGTDLLWGQLLDLHRAYEQRVAALREAGQPEPSAGAAAPEHAAGLEALLQQWDAALGQLWEALAPGTLAVVLTGQGDSVYTRYVQEQKYRRQQGLDGMPPWSPESEAALAAANARAVRALCFAAVKT